MGPSAPPPTSAAAAVAVVAAAVIGPPPGVHWVPDTCPTISTTAPSSLDVVPLTRNCRLRCLLRLRDLLAVETVATLNEAICWWHQSKCHQMTQAAVTKCEVSAASWAVLRSPRDGPSPGPTYLPLSLTW